MSRPLQNRVTPTGDIKAVPSRGTFLGNRGGRIHSDDQKLAKRWASKQWICCVLDFKDRQRTVMGEGYTELFFLDEATALAAGHRPCFECRRADALEFSGLWGSLRGRQERAKVAEMDKILHQERLGPHQTLDYEAIPLGSMVLHEGDAYLKSREGAQLWSFSGYETPIALRGQIKAITPKSIRDILEAGYTAKTHPTAAI